MVKSWVLVEQTLQKAGGINAVISADGFDGDCMFGAKLLKFLLGLQHRGEIFLLMHCYIDQMTMMINPEIAEVVTGFSRGAFCGGAHAGVSDLHLVIAYTITWLSVILIDGTRVAGVCLPGSFAKLAGKTHGRWSICDRCWDFDSSRAH
jgi:hypothetical protein